MPSLDPRDGDRSEDDSRDGQGPEVRLREVEPVGRVLRRARESYGEDLESVAQALRIRFVYLKAIEEARYGDLPGNAYAVGFVRTYADYLELDSAELVRRFKDEVEGIDKRQALVFPTPVPESKVPGGAILLIAIVGVALAYGGWLYLSSRDQPIAELVPPIPERLKVLVGMEEAGTGGDGSSDLSGEGANQAAGQAVPATGPDNPPQPGVRDDAQSRADTRVAAESREAAPGSMETAGLPRPADQVEVAPPPGTTGSLGTGAAQQTMAEQSSSAQAPLEQGDGQEAPQQAAQDAAQEAALPPPAVEAPATASVDPAAASGAEAGAAVENPAGDIESGSVTPPAEVETRQGTGMSLAGLVARQSGGEGAAPAAPEAPQVAEIPNLGGREPQVFGSDNETARIVLRATQDAWVQVRGQDQELLITRVLRPGDSYRVPDQAGLTLETGNAGGLEIIVDGRAISSLGPVGVVKRDVPLDPEQLQSGGFR